MEPGRPGFRRVLGRLDEARPSVEEQRAAVPHQGKSEGRSNQCPLGVHV